MTNMKKRICVVLLLVSTVVVLNACGEKAAPLSLPETKDVVSIDVSTKSNTTSHTDQAWIEEVVSGISASTPTRKQCVQDTPLVESYYRIDIQARGETITLFAYEDKGICYVEKPYEGIYKIDEATLEQIKKSE